ncbi:His Kinase A (phospho-acceptor) domain-containing protein [Paenibacillus sp. UNCCL117]|uniref:sensor histidine kinase n=1 Tax=unclassified Paenibacillus TaxID=185978 RepID=UPI00088DB919|nr:MULTISPECIES: HAMP domain-containing sensor histidine kinase [unclassified Paenibacillus]SDC53234.1 His Kinase A (phospho-acceptor) domain-containing protein [Paenibacillus sp. cl123]SFW11203.1 His Kinase A (phospho-acceptor) domain-containing protein [Paenibacillus sp. UNCCL117]
MFKQTRYRLALLFSLVFFVLINGLGATLYFSTENRLYSQTDRVLENEMNGLEGWVKRQIRREFPFRPMRLMTVLHWDAEGKLVLQIPRENVDDKLPSLLKEAGVNRAFVNVTVEGAEYRLLTRDLAEGRLQIAYNLEPERNVLNNLLVMIATGSLVSILIALLTGLFLAARALIPIRKAWEQQQQFVSDASHELRTPLSVLQIHLERLFRHPERTIEQESEKIAVMIDETRRMSKMVGDLLTLARSDASGVKLHESAIALPELVARAAGDFAELSRMRGIRLETYADEAVTMVGDSGYLHQLLVILLDNALRYTREGTITIRTAAEGNYVLLRIEDTGIGIGKDDLPRIFDRFYRADKVRGRGDGGTGLGLSIAKWIVEAHHGTIRAESEEGEGTVIEVRLPMERHARPAAFRRE